MALQKVQVTNNNQSWNEKRRYRIGEVVTDSGNIYQNFTGANSPPSSEVDWLFLKSVENITAFPKIQFIANGVDAVYELGTTSKANAVLWNGALLDDADWSQSGTTLTLTFIPISGEIIKPI